MSTDDPGETVVEAKDATLERAPLASLRALFETWPDEWILYRDADVIAVDKPVGISTHAPDDEHEDDVFTRLSARLVEAPDGEPPYLGIHQRLDRDTSGVLIFARRKSANPKLAVEFEGRRVAKTYLAVVEGKLRLPKGGLLRHTIEEDRDGRRVARPIAEGPTRTAKNDPRGGQRKGPARGKEAVTEVRVVSREGDRSLVELTPKTGRTHQLRVQLAASGAPIVGDTIYGGAPASRLMLHARRLELAHPTTGRPLVVESPTPPALDEALRGSAPALDVSSIEKKLREAAAKRYGIAARNDTDAFRIANGAGDGLPGVAVDAYGDYVVVHFSEDLSEPTQAAVFDAALALGAAGVYVKHRPKHASRIVDTRRDSFAPREAVRGANAPEAFLVLERGIPFEVRLGDGLSTGIFLDQRDNRALVRELSSGLRVLNLFAYTGSFSVAAALGGAARTTTVDVSRTVTAWTERNLARVGASAEKNVVIDADCFSYLAEAATRSERFDLVVLDPPSFATTKTSRFSADGGYRGLAALAYRILAPGGKLLACTNHQGIVMAKFRRFLHEAARDAGVTVAQMKNLPPPEDFPPPPGFEPHLKSVLVRIA